ncbi:MAG: 1-acyl-sn-glycerol-3-phosphate acyltransferase [Pseudomonadales bacterium]
MDDFEDIRPYRDDEVPHVIARLIDDVELLDFLGRYDSPRLARVLPGLVRILARRRVKQLLGQVTDIKSFQQVIAYYVRKLVNETMTSFTYDGIESLSKDKSYVFVSNHRDIAGDSMLVDFALHESGLDTARIAVGDNLVQRQFVTDLMKLNKSFFIKRSVSGAKKLYAALLVSSRFVRQTLEDGQSIWIAQAEGRAKDAMDLTDVAVIKMLALAERKKPFPEVVCDLNLVPVAISYEFDPCDVSKAKELFAIAADGSYIKPPGEDLLSLARGLGGFKGRVHVSFGKPLDGHYQTPEQVASELDQQILSGLKIFPINLLALAALAEKSPYSETWEGVRGLVEGDESAEFDLRLATCPEHLRRQWLAMYANPIVNKVTHGVMRDASLVK